MAQPGGLTFGFSLHLVGSAESIERLEVQYFALAFSMFSDFRLYRFLRYLNYSNAFMIIL